MLLGADVVTRLKPENPFLRAKASDWSAVSHYLRYVWHRVFPFMCRGDEETAKTKLLELLSRSSVTYHTIMAIAKYLHLRARNCEIDNIRHETSQQKKDDWEYHYDIAVSTYLGGSRVSHNRSILDLEEATVCVANFIFLQVSKQGHTQTGWALFGLTPP
jgi:hypothetical protein